MGGLTHDRMHDNDRCERSLEGASSRMKPETAFRQNKVLPFLKTLKNTAYFPIQQTAIHGDADYILCSYGIFVWLELKTDEGQLSPMQKYKAEWVERCNGVVLVARPSNWREVMTKLRLLDEGDYEFQGRL